MTDEPLGPGFDTVTLTRPTPRKLVCLWMEQAGLRTLEGANVRETAARLDVRWNQCCGLERLLEEARMVAENSCAMRFERMRTEWQREAARHGSPTQDRKGHRR